MCPNFLVLVMKKCKFSCLRMRHLGINISELCFFHTSVLIYNSFQLSSDIFAGSLGNVSVTLLLPSY